MTARATSSLITFSSMHKKQKRQEVGWGNKFSRLPPVMYVLQQGCTSCGFYNPFKQCHQLGIKYSNTCAYGGHVSSKLPHVYFIWVMKKATKVNAVGICVEKHMFPPEEDTKSVLEGAYRIHLVHVLSGSQSHWLCDWLWSAVHWGSRWYLSVCIHYIGVQSAMSVSNSPTGTKWWAQNSWLPDTT